MSIYIFAFCRTVIGCLFVLSLFGKLRNMSHFQQTINNFRLLPDGLTTPAAFLILAGEGAIILCMAYGRELLMPGFILALLSLVLFSFALAMVLKRNMLISCNCFGNSKQVVSSADIWRNLGFIFYALGGIVTTSILHDSKQSLSLDMWLVIGISSFVFTLIWSQFGEIARLLHENTQSTS